MTASIARRQLQSQDNLIRLSAPKLKLEPKYTPIRPPFTATMREVIIARLVESNKRYN